MSVEVLVNIQKIFRSILFIGYIAATVVVINAIFLGFRRVFGERSLRYWWLFLFLIIVPFLILLHFFSLFFLS